MKNLLNPKWIFLINTLPIVALFFLFAGQLSIIRSLLSESNIQYWTSFGVGLGLLGLANVIYAVCQIRRKQAVSAVYGGVALVVHILFIYLYFWNLFKIIPSNIPEWMFSEGMYFYLGTFLMPTLVYSLFVLITYLTPENKEHKPWVNFLIAISIPVAGYLFSLRVLPMWKWDMGEMGFHSFLTLLIVSTLVFFFFLVRGIYILARKKAASWRKYQLAWKIPIAIVLPLVGLLVNDGKLYDRYNGSPLGDFSSFWFYLLAIVNGILICLPSRESGVYRLALYVGRSITFAFTFYFFLVFLPFLPLSLVAIIALGVGFLMLTPLVLFIVHLNELSQDFAYLKTLFSKRILAAISVLGFLVIPAVITLTYRNDIVVLHEALEYVYGPDYSREYDIDKASIQRTIDTVKYHKNRDMFSSRLPYLSTYFDWLVLDSLTLSREKISYMERIFSEKEPSKSRSGFTTDKSVKLTGISGKSHYDQSQNAWRSWVDLELTNQGKANGWGLEYTTTIDLPTGCWISDYYLYVGERKEFGILAEKKAAMWIYSNIVNVNRDPGILYYLTGNKVAFRVFPFPKDEVRKTGIEFLHKEPVKLTIDGKTVELGNPAEGKNEKIETANFAYVSAQEKASLKAVQRQPYFHFLVDTSGRAGKHSEDFAKRIENFLEANKSLAANAQISFVGSHVKTLPLDKDWRQRLLSRKFVGGFYLERAINTALFHAHKKKAYPVIVVVTNDLKEAVLDKDFSDFKFAYPDSDLFFVLGEKGVARGHSLVDSPLTAREENVREDMFRGSVLEYKLADNSIAYLSNDAKPSIVLKNDFFGSDATAVVKEKNWESALAMQAKWMSQILHPETLDTAWLDLVRHSFGAQVMSPVTAYLVVENDAQKAMLKKKQEQVLSGNKFLDTLEDAQRMSEPALWIVALLLGLFIWRRERRKSCRG